jgi:mono/diheme cytochrome c family protein
MHCFSGSNLILIVVFATAGSANPAEPVTFNKDVAPILFQKCAGCHHPGEIAPFSLLSYKDAYKRAAFVKEITASKRMPPWKPQPGFGDELQDNLSLSEQQLKTIAQWVDSGAKEGDAADLPETPKFDSEWKLGKPDLILEMSRPYTIAAERRDMYRAFVMPTNLKEDVTIAGLEFRPGNPRVVHHVNIQVDSSGAYRNLKPEQLAEGVEPALANPTGMLSGWVPGLRPYLYPEDCGRTLMKDSAVIFNMHYAPTGKEETDQSKLGIYFAKKPVKNLLLPVLLGSTTRLRIPAGEKAYLTGATYQLPCDVRVITIAPHMHLLGREMKVVARGPKDNKIKPMICIPDWDFNWQGPYAYVKPVLLEKGTVLEMSAAFDNSADNPRNPFNPPRFVRGGPATTQEMCQCTLLVFTVNPEDRIPLRRDMVRARQEAKKGPKK